jgi:SAM-dependent methyltransferase
VDPLNLPSIAGDDYLAAMRRKESDRRVRVAFTALAERLVPPGGRIFDFGCGPGLDAKHYACDGHPVTGYDVDPRMQATFRRLCSEELERGQVRLDVAQSYEAFLAEPACRHGPAALITANFAPLNLVDDPARLFAKFASLLSDRGRVLASVLNPYHLGDARYGWWWRNLPALIRQQHYVVGAARVHRRTPTFFANAARPHFNLTRVMSAGGRADGGSGWRLVVSQYLFLQFERA